MVEEFATTGSVTLCYESFGNPEDPTLLLLTGMGAQLVLWPEEFCNALVGRGFRVVRFDHRDAGRSTILPHPTPAALPILFKSGSGATYSLGDMADDVVGLLDHLGVERAHLVGLSLGAIVSQVTATNHPDRVLSLTSIAGNTGRSKDHPNFLMRIGMLMPPPKDREKYVKQSLRTAKMLGSPDYPADEEAVRQRARVEFDRGLHPAGTRRQFAAVLAAGDRTAQLASITAPTLVVHGKADRVLPPSGGKTTAAAIPGARLMLLPGVGHETPPEIWPGLIDAIVENTARVS